MKRHIILISMLTILVISSCKKWVEVDKPKTTSTAQAMFSDDLSAISASIGLYQSLSSEGMHLQSGVRGSMICNAVSSDEMKSAQPDMSALFLNRLNANQPTSIPAIWTRIYSFIYSTNLMIEKLNESTTLTANVKQQLLGQCKFLRAWFYFYLVNNYGDVPLALSSDWKVNSELPRTKTVLIYNQIVSDLLEAKAKLSSNYLNGSLTSTDTERTIPTTWAASALLARVYLYMGSLGQGEKWLSAEEESSRVIGNTTLFDLPNTNLNSVFLKNSKEAIWQLQPTGIGWNTVEGQIFILNSTPLTYEKYYDLTLSQINAFESGDPRKANWIGSVTTSGVTYYYPYKYKKGALMDNSIISTSQMTEYSMMIRLAEQYLIRAEARAMQGNIVGAIDDINIVRKRARGLGSVPVDLPLSLSQTDVLNRIDAERRVELFSEGDRWFNLKRRGKIDEVMTAEAIAKNSFWESYQSLYPIPLEDIQRNPNLQGHQNPGY